MTPGGDLPGQFNILIHYLHATIREKPSFQVSSDHKHSPKATVQYPLPCILRKLPELVPLPCNGVTKHSYHCGTLFFIVRVIDCLYSTQICRNYS